MKSKEELYHISGTILDACITVHREMGPGLLESIYVLCLCRELIERGLKVQREISIPPYYKGKELSKDLRIDIIVEDEVILEIKAVDLMHPVYEAQIISYLKLTNKRLGFLINFNVPLLKLGFKRYVNKF